MAEEGQYRLYLKEIPQGEFKEEYRLDNSFFADREQFELFGGEVVVSLEGSRTGDVYDVTFRLQGIVETLCTRCEDHLHYPIKGEFCAVIKLADEDGGDDDEEIIISREHPTLFLDQLLYSFVVLSLPLRRVHPEGKCNKEIDAYLKQQEKHPSSNPFGILLQEDSTNDPL